MGIFGTQTSSNLHAITELVEKLIFQILFFSDSFISNSATQIAMMLLWITMLCFALVGGAPTGNLKKEPEKREAANVVKPVLVLPRYLSSKGDNYVVYKAKKNWDDARRACQAIGGDLASIYSGSD